MQRRNLWLGILSVILLVLVVYFLTGWYFSGLMIAPPRSSLVDARAQTGDPADYGLPQPENVTIDAGKLRLSGWYFDNPQNGDCGVLFMHGFTGTRYQALYWAPLFWERGCDILAYDHRGHGESTPALLSYGVHEKMEAKAARDWFAVQSGLDPSRIGIAGVSYGAATALQAAPLLPEAPFILADSSYRSMPAIVGVRAEARLGTLVGRILTPGALVVAGLRGGFNPWAASPEDAIAEAAMPVLLIHSRTDEFTPAAHSEAIFAGSDQSRTVLHVNDWGSAHGSDIGTDFAAYRREFNTFLAQYAPDFGNAPQP